MRFALSIPHAFRLSLARLRSSSNKSLFSYQLALKNLSARLRSVLLMFAGCLLLTGCQNSENAHQLQDPLANLRQGQNLTAEQERHLGIRARGTLAHYCYRCHGAARQEGGLRFDVKEALLAGGETGPAFLAGEPDESEMLMRMALPHDDDEAMPAEGRRVPEREQTLLRNWIAFGAPWPAEKDGLFPQAGVSLASPALDLPEDVHPIDHLVNEHFRQNGISWPTRLPDGAFLRKASIDISGLLPGTEQLQAFLADTSPKKRSAMIAGMLQNDHAYAQGWLAWWNDLLRNDYGGTGYITQGRRRITRWLYDGLVANQSWPQMVRDLIDAAPGAEGFLHGVLWRGAVNASQKREMQAAQNISQVMLGMNLKCASCHNSFVSNISLREAYAFAAVFADSALEINRCDAPTGVTAKPAFILPELGDIAANTSKQRRANLAKIITGDENGRLYRTFVNRVWARLIGRGIVEPLDEMDRQPWSQPLLDWLAADFRAHEGDIRHLIRTIMTSRIYQSEFVRDDDNHSTPNVFSGPLARRLTAEQLSDAFSQVLTPLDAGVAFDPGKTGLPARWIWHREIALDRTILPLPGKRWFRKGFSSPRRAKFARVLVTADHAFTLYLNGKPVARGDNWRQVVDVKVRRSIRRGENQIAVLGENDGTLPNPAGLIVFLQIVDAQDSSITVISDGSWKTSAEEPPLQWLGTRFDDSAWPKAQSLGTQGSNGYWGQLVDFRLQRDPGVLAFARASLVRNNAFQKALGRPSRDVVVTRRDENATLISALEMNNGAYLQSAVLRGAASWQQHYENAPDELIRALHWLALSRAPTAVEQQLCLDALRAGQQENALPQLLWAILMLPEFQFI